MTFAPFQTNLPGYLQPINVLAAVKLNPLLVSVLTVSFENGHGVEVDITNALTSFQREQIEAAAVDHVKGLEQPLI